MKYVLLIVLVLIVGTMVFVFGLFGTDDKTIVVSMPAVESETVNDAEEEKTGEEEDARYAAMQAEYKKLEKARRNLDRRLARIKAVMWNVQLPAEQAEALISRIRKGYELLKSKKLLGAFSSLQGISDELARVDYVHQNLQGVVEEIKAAKSGT